MHKELYLSTDRSLNGQVGVTWTTTTVTTTTSSSGAGGNANNEVIKSTWEIARKNGNVAPKTLFR
jgi:hypothetical protein